MGTFISSADVTRRQEAADNHPTVVVLNGHAVPLSHKVRTTSNMLGGRSCSYVQYVALLPDYDDVSMQHPFELLLTGQTVT